MKHLDLRRTFLWLTVFSIAMAYLESAVVVYLRAILYPGGFDFPLAPMQPGIAVTEVFREAATIVMLLGAGYLGGRYLTQRFAWFIYCFAVWDIFYYVWLYVFIQWPKSFFEWDILFLIPLPWWGPVITPVLISLLLILIGYLLISEVKFKVTSIDWIGFILSIIVLLYTFTEDSIKVIISGTGDLTEIRPTAFNWILFLIAYLVWFGTSIKVFYLSKKNE